LVRLIERREEIPLVGRPVPNMRLMSEAGCPNSGLLSTRTGSASDRRVGEVVGLQANAQGGSTRQGESALDSGVELPHASSSKRVAPQRSQMSRSGYRESGGIEPAVDPHRHAGHEVRTGCVVERKAEGVFAHEDIDRKAGAQPRDAVQAPTLYGEIVVETGRE
jgi:hypothetical protein